MLRRRKRTTWVPATPRAAVPIWGAAIPRAPNGLRRSHQLRRPSGLRRSHGMHPMVCGHPIGCGHPMNFIVGRIRPRHGSQASKLRAGAAQVGRPLRQLFASRLGAIVPPSVQVAALPRISLAAQHRRPPLSPAFAKPSLGPLLGQPGGPRKKAVATSQTYAPCRLAKRAGPMSAPANAMGGAAVGCDDPRAREWGPYGLRGIRQPHGVAAPRAAAVSILWRAPAPTPADAPKRRLAPAPRPAPWRFPPARRAPTTSRCFG